MVKCKIRFLQSATGKHKSTHGDRRQLGLQQFDGVSMRVHVMKPSVWGGLLNKIHIEKSLNK